MYMLVYMLIFNVRILNVWMALAMSMFMTLASNVLPFPQIKPNIISF